MNGYRIASWNVNSLKARIDNVKNWLVTNDIDILCLQETKLHDSAFLEYVPIFQNMGFKTYHNGIGQYNGVALFSKKEPVMIHMGFSLNDEPNMGVDYPECRLIKAYYENLIIYNVYVPNGRSLEDIHMQFKLKWLRQLRVELESELKSHGDKSIIVCGDFNIAPVNEDVKDIGLMVNSTHVSEPERQALKDIESMGFIDVGLSYVLKNKTESKFRFTWWDYRQLAFQKNDGMRIDLFLVWNKLTDGTSGDRIFELVTSYETHRDVRKEPKPSDHVPIVISLNLT